MEQASQGLPGGSDQLEGTSPSFDFSRAELWGGGGNPSSRLGDTLGGALLTGSTPSEGEPLCALLCRSTRAAASGSGGLQAAGVTHDVTDNDTSRVSQSDTAPELHSVTLGTLRPRR